MRIHTIKSKKQDNGLWGTPMNLSSLGLYNHNNREQNDQLLLSALIIKFDELYNVPFKVKVYDDFILFSTENNYNYQTKLVDHALIGNKLYFLNGNEDKRDFNRMIKLNKLCGGRTK